MAERAVTMGEWHERGKGHWDGSSVALTFSSPNFQQDMITSKFLLCDWKKMWTAACTAKNTHRVRIHEMD